MQEEKPFRSDGWAKEELPGDRYKMTIPRTHLAMRDSTGQVFVKTGWAIEAGDVIVVGDIEALVTHRETVWDNPKYTWLLTVECEREDELRELLTYHVEDTE